MIIRYTEKEFNQAKSNDKLACECEYCHTIFYKSKHSIVQVLNGTKIGKVKYCSKRCANSITKNKQEVSCYNCNKTFLKFPSQIKRSLRQFCSSSCAATYNNQHKTTGNRRSKLEKYLEEELSILYPTLEIHYNRKDAINSELDIYIPALKLAFELNGIFHYEPIYGSDKFAQIQNNDNRKFKACLDQDISLCIIDTSKMNYFKKNEAIKYLSIIVNIINSNLGASSRA